MTLTLNGSLVLVGAGKMGGAMLAGWLSRGLDPKQVLVLDPGPPPEVAALLEEHRIQREASAEAIRQAPAVIVMAVKPQMMDDVLPPIARRAGSGTLLISIAAGRTIASFEKHLPEGTAVVRTMPNTPAAIGRGITVCVGNAATNQQQRSTCEALLSAVGEVGWVEDEGLIDAVTAVSGSGPAYVFLLAECMTRAGVEAGLDAELSARLAAATIAGSGELMRQSGIDPSSLRKNVTSPGGTTAAALSVLMAEDGLQALMTRAILAARDRGRELAG